jgi:hypothetical protein
MTGTALEGLHRRITNMPAPYSRTAPSLALEASCPECGTRFDIKRAGQTFCNSGCQVAFNNRALSRGQALVTLALTWRGGRSSRDAAVKLASKEAFSQLAALTDRYNAEDRAAGRPPGYETFIRRRLRGQGVMER